jgi:Spy/CpxP family protein refolding chaperone
MRSAFKTDTSLHSLALATLLAIIGASAMAQNAPTVPTAPTTQAGSRMGKHDPAKMQAMMAKRQTELKASLKITPAQEGAWTTYTAAMQPPAGMHARPTPDQRAELDKLTTPQRIDKMREMRNQRTTDMSASMNKRGDATKALYSALTPEQQKAFDAREPQHLGHGSRGGSNHQVPRG